jgi:hypothetical protein
MWHPNSQYFDLTGPIYAKLCHIDLQSTLMALSAFPSSYVPRSSLPFPSISLFAIQHAPGDDQYGYEDAGERWMPVHTVESIVSYCLDNIIAQHHSLTPIAAHQRYLSPFLR